MLHQSPRGAVTKSTAASSEPLFDFGAISEWLIPRQEFCNQLIVIRSGQHRVVGHPICIVDEEKYDRNQFIFNFALVLAAETEFSGYEKLVRRVSCLFCECEERNSFLSKDEEQFGQTDNFDGTTESGSRVHAICEAVMEDLNHYTECVTPIGMCALVLV